MYVFSQEEVIWSNMMYSCLARSQEQALAKCKNSGR